MKELYHVLFDHVAFPVLAINEKDIVIYKNSQSRKYHKEIRCRASIRKHLKSPANDICVVIAGDTPYPVGVRLTDEDGTLCLFLTRFQYPDGKMILSRMVEAYGSNASDFLITLKNKTEALQMPARTYSDLLLITEQEKMDFGIGYHSPLNILHPYFQKLSKFSVLGYRIETTISEQYNETVPIRTSPYELLYRFSHTLYLLMRISHDKSITICLSTDRERAVHTIKLQTQTELSEASLDVEDFSSLVPECIAEQDLLSRCHTFSEMTHLTVDDTGLATLVFQIPCEQKSGFHSLHSYTNLTAYQKIANICIRTLQKRLENIQ